MRLMTYVVGVLGATLVTVAHAAKTDQNFPRPGLYRIEAFDATNKQMGHVAQVATANSRSTLTLDGQLLSSANAPQQTQCIKPYAKVPAFKGMARCKVLKSTATSAHSTLHVQCSDQRHTIVSRKTGADDYEITSKTEMLAGAPTAANPASAQLEIMKSMRQQMSPQERAKFDKDLPRMTQEAKAMDAQMAQVQQQMPQFQAMQQKAMQETMAQAKTPQERAALQKMAGQMAAGAPGTLAQTWEVRTVYKRLGECN